MKAIILAAGRGSRMKDLTEERPKCLMELRGKSLLDWQLHALLEAGIEQIGIVTGYQRERLTDRNLVEFHNARWSETNMVSSLACAREWLLAEPCIVSYSDIVYDAVAVKSLMDSHAALAVTYDPNWLELWTKRFSDPLLDAETFNISDAGILLNIGQKPVTSEDIQGQYMGLLRFSPQGWREVERVRAGLLPKERDTMHMTGTLQKIIEAGRVPVHGIVYEGDWAEIDSPDDLKHASGN